MRTLQEIAQPEITNLKPCTHGGEVFEAAERLGLNPKKLLDYSANINPLGPPPRAIEAVKAHLWEVQFYPEAHSNRLREALAHHIGGITPENIIVGNGSTELIHMFTQVFLKNGEEALIPSPTFGEYETAVLKAGGKPSFVEAGRNLSISSHEVLGKVNSQTRLIFLCNPNNPTGLLIPQGEVRSILEEAWERDILVLLDEDCMDFVEDEKRLFLAGEVEKYPNLFTLRSFTKFFALPGLRIGYGVASKNMVELLSKAKVPWNVNCLAQAAALKALENCRYQQKTRETIKKERLFLTRELGSFRGLKVYPSEANFILINIENTGLTADKVKERMLEHRILIRDCSSFRGLNHHYIRVTVRSRRENMRLIKALRKVLR